MNGGMEHLLLDAFLRWGRATALPTIDEAIHRNGFFARLFEVGAFYEIDPRALGHIAKEATTAIASVKQYPVEREAVLLDAEARIKTMVRESKRSAIDPCLVKTIAYATPLTEQFI